MSVDKINSALQAIETAAQQGNLATEDMAQVARDLREGVQGFVQDTISAFEAEAAKDGGSSLTNAVESLRRDARNLVVQGVNPATQPGDPNPTREEQVDPGKEPPAEDADDQSADDTKAGGKSK